MPKTIDNDLGGHRLHVRLRHRGEHRDGGHRPPAHDGGIHHRALIVEVMGRHAGWIALHAGMAGGANVILIPERPFDIEQVCAYIEHRFQSHYAPIVVVAEGATPAEGTMELATGDARRVRPRAPGRHRPAAGRRDREAHRQGGPRTVLGHIQRGGTPTAFDRVLATRFGLHAIEAVHDGDFGMMVALRGTDIVRVPLAEATSELKTVPAERYAEAEVFFG